MQATIISNGLKAAIQNNIDPKKYVSAGNPIIVIADMVVTDIESPTGIYIRQKIKGLRGSF